MKEKRLKALSHGLTSAGTPTVLSRPDFHFPGGFGQYGTFGGGIPSPTMDKLAAEGLRYNRFHTTALCSPTRAALITGRNHHSTSFAGITELATGSDGYTCILPKCCGTVGEVIGKNHNTPTWETSAAGPFDRCDTGSPASPDYGPTGNAFSGDINWVQIDLGDDKHNHLITAEDRFRTCSQC